MCFSGTCARSWFWCRTWTSSRRWTKSTKKSCENISVKNLFRLEPPSRQGEFPETRGQFLLFMLFLLLFIDLTVVIVDVVQIMEIKMLLLMFLCYYCCCCHFWSQFGCWYWLFVIADFVLLLISMLLLVLLWCNCCRYSLL